MLDTVNRLVHRAYSTRVEALVHRTGLYPWLYGVYERLLGFAYRPDTYTLTLDDTDVEFHTLHDAEITSLLHTMEKERAVIDKFTRRLEPEDVVWDVGANLGVYSVASAPFVEYVVGFEPHPVTAGRARENLALNGFENAEVRELGLWDETETRSLATDRDELGTQTPTVSVDGDLDIDLVRGCEVDAPRPTVMKIDVEGAEARVLAGLEEVLSSVRLVLVEAHEAGCVEWLSARGYTVSTIGAHNGEKFVLAEREQNGR